MRLVRFQPGAPKAPAYGDFGFFGHGPDAFRIGKVADICTNSSSWPDLSLFVLVAGLVGL